MSNTKKKQTGKSARFEAKPNPWEGRRGRFAPVGSNIPKLTDPVFRKRGFAGGEIIRRWGEIVGPELDRACQPVKLAYGKGATLDGILTIRAAGGAALMIEHSSPQIIARINQFYGYRAVGRLKIVQARTKNAFPAPKRPKKPASLPPARESALQEQLSEIENAELRAALARLGREILVDKSD